MKKRQGVFPPVKAVLGLGLSLVLLAGCAHGPRQTTLQRIQKAGVVKVGFANEAPYAYLDPKTGRLTGESPEIARVILKQMGVTQVKGVLTEFGSLIPGLKAGRFDLIAAGMYITPARAKEIAFSNPTYGIGEAFAVAKGNPLHLHSYEDVAKNPKTRLGLVAGTVEMGYARDLKIPDAQVVVFPDAPSALEGVEAGRVDAFAGTSLTVADLLRKANNPKLELALPFTDPTIHGKSIRGYGAFGFRKKDQDLVDAFNRGLAGFIGTHAHLKLVAPFGFTKRDLPGKVTAAELGRP